MHAYQNPVNCKEEPTKIKQNKKNSESDDKTTSNVKRWQRKRLQYYLFAGCNSIRMANRFRCSSRGVCVCVYFVRWKLEIVGWVMHENSTNCWCDNKQFRAQKCVLTADDEWKIGMTVKIILVIVYSSSRNSIHVKSVSSFQSNYLRRAFTFPNRHPKTKCLFFLAFFLLALFDFVSNV